MRSDKKRWALCLAAAMSLSLTIGMNAMASETETEEFTESITEELTEEMTEESTEDNLEGMDGNREFAIHVNEMTDEEWESLAMVNGDKVETGINIRETGNEDSPVVACIYRGAAVKVLDTWGEWSEIQSGRVHGYIKNEYLLFGEEARELAKRISIDGVETNWDDVHVFDAPDANAAIIYVAGAREVFPMVDDQGHWLTISIDKKLTGEESAEEEWEDETSGEEETETETETEAKDTTRQAYVSIEDVTKVWLVDAAVPMENYVPEEYYEEDNSYSDDTYYAPEPTYTDNSNNNSTYTTPAPSDSNSGNSGDTGSTGSGSSTTNQDYTYDDGDDDYVEDDGSDDVYNDDSGDYNSEDDEYEDVEEIEDAEEYADYAAAYAEETYGYSETETYTDYEYSESAETYTDYDTESAESSVSAGDVDLMAAIIYCEAGNQSYDGMVAVGAVVMNRVYSSSFPNTISEVIYQSGQFTPASSGSLASALANGVPSACYDAAYAAMSGENPVGSALYFNTGSGSGVKIGDHQFF